MERKIGIEPIGSITAKQIKARDINSVVKNFSRQSLLAKPSFEEKTDRLQYFDYRDACYKIRTANQVTDPILI